MNYKFVKLKDVHLVIHGCTDTLHRHEDIEDAWAVIEVVGRDYEIRVNGEPVSLESLPSRLKGVKLDIVNDEVNIIVYYHDKGKVCKGFTDGEYAYMPCIDVGYIAMLTLAQILERGVGLYF